LGSLLASTALLYLWNLSASGYGNTFYAVAAQAGSQRWSSWFFGSLDDTCRGPVIDSHGRLDERRSNQQPTRAPVGCDAHAVVGRDQRLESAATLEISSSTAMMAVGGWSGDPVPTLQQFIDDVHAGKISYYIAAHYPGTMIGGSTVYRLA
jgi:hypothetical protein